jgi:hypothetical protein
VTSSREKFEFSRRNFPLASSAANRCVKLHQAQDAAAQRAPCLSLGIARREFEHCPFVMTTALITLKV